MARGDLMEMIWKRSSSKKPDTNIQKKDSKKNGFVKRVLREISILSAASIRRWRPVARYSTHVLLWDESVRRAWPVAGRPNFISSKMGCIVFLLFFRWHFMWPKMDSIDSMMTYQGYVFWSLCFWCLEFGDSGTQSDLWKNTSPCGEILHWSQTLRSLSASALDANDPRSYQWSSWCFMFGRSNYEKNIAGFRCQSDWIPGIRCIYSPQVWHVFWAGHCVDFTRAWETTIVDLRKRE